MLAISPDAEYKNRPYVELQDVLGNIDDLGAHFWDAIGADGVVGDLGCAEETMMGYIENYDDAALGEYVRKQVVKFLIRGASDKIKSKHQFQDEIEDMESAIL